MPAKVGYMSAPNRATQNHERKEVYLVPFAGSPLEALEVAVREMGQGKCQDEASIRRLLPKRNEFVELALKVVDRSNTKLYREIEYRKTLVDEDQRRVTQK